jgi:ABC-2 type transport system permease protein
MSATTTSSAASTTLTPIPGSAITRFVSDGWVTTWRNLMKIIRVPEILLFSLIQPIMFVLLFTYVFGAAIDIPGDGYTSCSARPTQARRWRKTSKTASSTAFARCP